MSTIKHGAGLLLTLTSKYSDGTIRVLIEKQTDAGIGYDKMELYFNEEDYGSFIAEITRKFNE